MTDWPAQLSVLWLATWTNIGSVLIDGHVTICQTLASAYLHVHSNIPMGNIPSTLPITWGLRNDFVSKHSCFYGICGIGISHSAFPWAVFTHSSTGEGDSQSSLSVWGFPVFHTYWISNFGSQITSIFPTELLVFWFLPERKWKIYHSKIPFYFWSESGTSMMMLFAWHFAGQFMGSGSWVHAVPWIGQSDFQTKEKNIKYTCL
jgi:hypothetical protein